MPDVDAAVRRGSCVTISVHKVHLYVNYRVQYRVFIRFPCSDGLLFGWGTSYVRRTR